MDEKYEEIYFIFGEMGVKEVKMEIWKDIKDFNNYEINNYGVIRIKKNKKILKYYEDKDKYYTINLWGHGKSKHFRVSRLVAQTFIPNPNNLPVVNHKDENKQNNCVENLEWCTVAYNNAYGTKGQRSGKKQKNKLRYTKANKKVAQFDLKGDFIEKYKSIMTVAKKLNKDGTHIVDVCKGRRKTAYGYKWRYIDE